MIKLICIFNKFDEIWGALYGTKLIYVPSKQMMLMIGGTMFDYSPIHGSTHTAAIGIWKFCLNTQKWSKLMDFDYKYVDSALSLNENYIIIAGGYEGHVFTTKSNKIFVLDLRDEIAYKLKECKIELPKSGPCSIVRVNMKHEILTIGWMRRLFRTKEFKDLILPPIYLLKMISSWYSQEIIHWFDVWYTREKYRNKNETHSHQKIHLKYILSNL